jgi:hypothetical protein
MKISCTRQSKHDFPIRENKDLPIFQPTLKCAQEGWVVNLYYLLGVHQLEVDLHLLYWMKMFSS